MLYRNVCILYIQYAYTLCDHMSTSGVVILYTQDEAVNPQTPRKYTVLNGNSVSDLRDVFQERLPGAK